MQEIPALWITHITIDMLLQLDATLDDGLSYLT